MDSLLDCCDDYPIRPTSSDDDDLNPWLWDVASWAEDVVKLADEAAFQDKLARIGTDRR